jgi:replicative DNA helicase
VFFTLEMSPKQLVYRLLAGESGVRSRQLHSGFLANDDFPKLAGAIENLDNLPFYLDGRARDTAALRAVLAGLVRRHNVRWFILDYLMLMTDPGKDENEKTANISRGLKNICTDLDVAGFVLHSVVKAGMDREATSEAASKSYLRGSGQVIHDADMVLFLTQFTPENGLSFYTDDQKKRMATLWVKKGRELEDPRLRVQLVRRAPSPFFGELEK